MRTVADHHGGHRVASLVHTHRAQAHDRLERHHTARQRLDVELAVAAAGTKGQVAVGPDAQETLGVRHALLQVQYRPDIDVKQPLTSNRTYPSAGVTMNVA